MCVGACVVDKVLLTAKVNMVCAMPYHQVHKFRLDEADLQGPHSLSVWRSLSADKENKDRSRFSLS